MQKIRISDLMEAIDFESETNQSYYWKKRCEIVTIFEDDMFGDVNDAEILEAFEENENDFLNIPTKYEFHEYKVMESFILELDDKEKHDKLFNAIKGSGVFRKFKDEIHRLEIEGDWYKYKDTALKELAIEWCEENDIPYEEY